MRCKSEGVVDWRCIKYSLYTDRFRAKVYNMIYDSAVYGIRYFKCITT